MTVFTLGVYVERKIGIILPGDISYGPLAMPHIIHFMLCLLVASLVTLYKIFIILYIPLRGCI